MGRIPTYQQSVDVNPRSSLKAPLELAQTPALFNTTASQKAYQAKKELLNTGIEGLKQDRSLLNQFAQVSFKHGQVVSGVINNISDRLGHMSKVGLVNDLNTRTSAYDNDVAKLLAEIEQDGDHKNAEFRFDQEIGKLREKHGSGLFAGWNQKFGLHADSVKNRKMITLQRWVKKKNIEEAQGLILQSEDRVKKEWLRQVEMGLAPTKGERISLLNNHLVKLNDYKQAGLISDTEIKLMMSKLNKELASLSINQAVLNAEGNPVALEALEKRIKDDQILGMSPGQKQKTLAELIKLQAAAKKKVAQDNRGIAWDYLETKYGTDYDNIRQELERPGFRHRFSKDLGFSLKMEDVKWLGDYADSKQTARTERNEKARKTARDKVTRAAWYLVGQDKEDDALAMLGRDNILDPKERQDQIDTIKKRKYSDNPELVSALEQDIDAEKLTDPSKIWQVYVGRGVSIQTGRILEEQIKKHTEVKVKDPGAINYLIEAKTMFDRTIEKDSELHKLRGFYLRRIKSEMKAKKLSPFDGEVLDIAEEMLRKTAVGKGMWNSFENFWSNLTSAQISDPKKYEFERREDLKRRNQKSTGVVPDVSGRVTLDPGTGYTKEELALIQQQLERMGTAYETATDEEKAKALARGEIGGEVFDAIIWDLADRGYPLTADNIRTFYKNNKSKTNDIILRGRSIRRKNSHAPRGK
jgi:hypothetical protein